MENVYLDLHLEEEHDHRDNLGWMNLFRNWSWATMFRLTWDATSITYGARFRTFCERRLNLATGDAHVVESHEQPAGLSRWLNFAELEYADEVGHALDRSSEGSARPALTYHALALSLEQPLQHQSSELPIGFAVTAPRGDTHMLVYLRIQDHLRHVGMAEKAVRAIATKLRPEAGDRQDEKPPLGWYPWTVSAGKPVTFGDDQTRWLIDRRSLDEMVTILRRCGYR